MVVHERLHAALVQLRDRRQEQEDARLAARERLSRQRHHRDHARAAEAAMPLAEHFRRRRGLRALPAGPDICSPGCSGCRRRSA